MASNINNKLFPTPIPMILTMGLSPLIIALITAFYIPQNYAPAPTIRSNILWMLNIYIYFYLLYYLS